ncbi:hydrolase, TatD family [Dehalogenimonas lykanthroporepellens BL-DC-9]|jgi:TatD DNase family protein|nr:hydrolase, TatD family [Dehalogenimonas lykanthroporepellens BL-DC-9]
MTMKLIDSHAHLDLSQFSADLDAVLKRATDAGISRIITIGIDLRSSREAVRLAETYDNIYASVGIHPCDSGTADETTLTEIEKLAAMPRVVAIGETGMDFYHKPFSEANQRESLLFHLDLAVRTNLPVVIHNRQADQSIVPLLLKWAESNPSHPKGVIHCFNDKVEVAQRYINAGFHISVGGYVTYPSAKSIHESLRGIPLNRLLLETDCPFLPPQGHRGQRNEPAYLVQTAEALAEIRDIPVKELTEATTANTERLFALP